MMDIVIKSLVICLVAALLATVLKKSNPEMALLLALGVVAVVLLIFCVTVQFTVTPIIGVCCGTGVVYEGAAGAVFVGVCEGLGIFVCLFFAV